MTVMLERESSVYPVHIDCVQDVLRRSHSLLVNAAARITNSCAAPLKYAEMEVLRDQFAEQTLVHETVLTYSQRTIKSLNPLDEPALNSMCKDLRIGVVKFSITEDAITITGPHNHKMIIQRTIQGRALELLVTAALLVERR